MVATDLRSEILSHLRSPHCIALRVGEMKFQDILCSKQLVGGGFNQPIWKMCSPNWIISRVGRVENEKYLNCHYLDSHHNPVVVLRARWTSSNSCLGLWGLKPPGPSSFTFFSIPSTVIGNPASPAGKSFITSSSSLMSPAFPRIREIVRLRSLSSSSNPLKCCIQICEALPSCHCGEHFGHPCHCTSRGECR